MLALAWTYLIAAGLFEIGWPVGLKDGLEVPSWKQESNSARELGSKIDGLLPKYDLSTRSSNRGWKAAPTEQNTANR